MNKFIRSGLITAGVLAATASHAALDVTAATTAIGDIGPAIAAVFGALIVVYGAAKGYKFVLAFVGK